MDAILEPDTRQLGTVILNHQTGTTRKRDLSEHHASIDRIHLSPDVPEDVQNQFTTAKHLLLYSWFAYRFVVVAELQAYATLEFALRSIFGHDPDDRPPTLGPLLKKAVKKGLVRDEAFVDLRKHPWTPIVTGNAFFDVNFANSPSWDPAVPRLDVLVSMLPELRNMLAHGSTNLWPGGIGTLLVVGTFLDELYRPRHEAHKRGG